MLGTIPVKVRLRYQERTNHKLKHVQTTFQRYCERMKNYSTSIEQQSHNKRKNSKSLDVPYAANIRIATKLYIQIGLPWPPFYELLTNHRNVFCNPKMWCGAPGSGTPLHCDSRDNFALQLVGEKKWWLVPPYCAREANYVNFRDRYCIDKELKDNEKKQKWKIDTEKVGKSIPSWSILTDIRQHIKQTGSLTFYDQNTHSIELDILVITLKPMEMLYLPVYYGHAIENLSMSFMVNFWDKNLPGLLS